MKSNKKKQILYNVAILDTFSPELAYYHSENLESGRVVRVKLRGKPRRGVIISKLPQVEFQTLPIDEVDDEYVFREHQIKFAKFISKYYFSSLSEALSLFIPYRKGDFKETVDIENFCSDTLPKLSSKQLKVYQKLSEQRRVLLFGVTGSGKTELYITKVAEVLSRGESAIILMPEISLTPQMERRLKGYFGQAVAMWHSKLSRKRREETINEIWSGRVRVVAGARSALFVPLERLGLIVVDEEHDDSYKSKRRPRYNARDLAIYFAKELKATVWLGSATPTLNSYIKYPTVRLKKPFIESEKRFKFLSGDGITQEILKYIEENFKKRDQTLLFVPTRANFKYLYCSQCGAVQHCPFCSVGMSLNRWKRYLRCHYCNYTQPIESVCGECGYSPMSSARMGTQEVIEIVKSSIEGIRVEQFDRDAITTFKKLQSAIDRIGDGESDLIVGTQMLSKGHDYPNITLSIILGIDHLLGISDYRAKERAVGLLHQIAGRSGRVKESTVLIQTSQKEQFAPYIEDYERFLRDEKGFAEDFYPPFVRFGRLLIANRAVAVAENIVNRVVGELKRFKDVEIVGYGKAPIEKIANRYRYSVLLRAKKSTDLLKAIYSIDRSGVEVDIDPVDFS